MINYKIYEGKIIAWNWNEQKQTDKIELHYTGTDYCMIYNKILENYEEIAIQQKYKHLHFLIWEDDTYEIQIEEKKATDNETEV